MGPEKPPFWDEPEGEIIRWIVFGEDQDNPDGYTKDELKQRYFETIRRRDHAWDSEIRLEAGFEKCWESLIRNGVFWYKPDGIYWVKSREYYYPYLDYYAYGPLDVQAEIEELYMTDEPVIKRALQLVKKPMIMSRHQFISGMELHNFLCNIIDYAKHRIIVVSPYVHKTDITTKLARIQRRNKDLKINFIYRTLKSNSFGYEEQVAGVTYLIENKINVIPNEKVHAKILVIDDNLAVISSYNWTPYPATGDSWEAGIITFDPEVIDETLNSIRESLLT